MPRQRIEEDSMGEVRVPAGAWYGAQTQRAVENFAVSGIRLPGKFIAALGSIKRAAALSNAALGLLDRKIAGAIAEAAAMVAEGKLDDQFVVDVFQTGSGTSTNMNANEVIANRAIALLGGRPGSRTPVHPNDHVNMGQSSNDVIPTAMHISALASLEGDLIPALRGLETALARKATEFDDVIKIGRTHLQDAAPVRLGQEFSGWARQVSLGIRRIGELRTNLGELALGGSAVGTGLNTHPRFARMTIARLRRETGLPLREAENHFEAQSARDAMVEASGTVRTVAISLSKIAQDIRWLASGPRGGIGEIVLPPVQPGSSIMPGKVNPVMCESLLQVCVQVHGNDLVVTMAAQGSNFELNTMMPVMANAFLQSVSLLSRAVALFTSRCVVGIEADRDRCRETLESSLVLITALAPVIGYDRAAAIAKRTHEQGRGLREVLEGEGLLARKDLRKLLEPAGMTGPTGRRPRARSARGLPRRAK